MIVHVSSCPHLTLLELPLQFSSESNRWNLSFTLCLGDDLIEETNKFCVTHDVCSPYLSVLILINCLRALMVTYPTEISINYLDESKHHRVFFAHSDGAGLDASITETCSQHGFERTHPQCSEIAFRFLVEAWKSIDLVIRRRHEAYFSQMSMDIIDDENIVSLIDPPNPISFPPGLGTFHRHSFYST